ncbi:MAG: amino acid adenylation domain-containing protein [Defluviitaleaceae bacterium]|nr:amino acid adenylation domain-containing protein [Defluviitaleaceae bacterium]
MTSEKSKNNIEDIYSLTPMQEGILFHHLEDSSSSAYVIQNIIHVEGNFDDEYILKALDLLSKRHSSLRTAIAYEGLEKPLQVVLNNRNIEYKSIDLSKLEELEKEIKIKEVIKKDLDRGYNLTNDSLLRLTKIKTDKNVHKLIWNFNHIIIDGWCLSIIFVNFFEYYSYIEKGKHNDISFKIENDKKIGAKYSDYIKWISSKNLKASLSHWGELLAGYDSNSVIDSFEKLEETENQMDRLELSIGKEISEKVLKLSKENGITINTIMEAVWAIILQKYNNSNDIVFGKVVSGRDANIKGIEEMVGLFINTIPVRVNNNDNKSAIDLWQYLQEQYNSSIGHHHCSLADIQQNSTQGSNLIKTLFVFENYHVDSDKLDSYMKDYSVQIEYGREQTNYDISVSSYFKSENLNISIMYNPNKYSKYEIILLLDRINLVLEKTLENPNIKVKDIEIVSSFEKIKILKDFNNTQSNYPKDKTVIKLFEECVENFQNKIAVTYNNKSLSYNELNLKANKLAHFLIKKGVGRNDFVGIFCEKNLEMIIGILGILKTGAAYVPIDSNYPEERVKYILEDCKPKFVLSTKEIVESEKEVEISNFEQINEPEDLIYVIYTSGTTGTPKGVMVEHKNVVRLVKNNNYVPLNEETKILQTGSLAFDASTFEIYGSLLNGGKLFLLDTNDLTDISIFKENLTKYNINTTFITTTLFHQFINIDESLFDSVSNLLVGGEVLSGQYARKLINRKTANLINVYGPTENTTFTTSYSCEKIKKIIPIGKPINNTKVYILDNNNNLCGIGIPGELCICGDGVSRGYLNKEDLTIEKFIDNPYGKGKLYRSGDLVKWLKDGNIEYIGRIDEQVKIRGFRIELGEIESVLKNQNEVSEVAVVVKYDSAGEKILCAYIVGNENLEIDFLKKELLKYIPNYMIPSYIVKIEKMPITANGKLDKKSLPDFNIELKKSFIAPKTNTEKILNTLFKDILGLGKVSINDNFFELGGHSLRASKLVNRIESETGVKIHIKDVFNFSTIEQLGNIIDIKNSNYIPIPRATLKEFYDMSSAQKRIYIIQQMDKNNLVYNMPHIIKIKGHIDLERIKYSFSSLINRHEILRTNFIMKDDELKQKILESVNVDVSYVVDKNSSESEIVKRFIKSFDLSKDLLVRINLIERKEHFLLIFDMHHIISDGMSMGTFIKEFSNLYNGIKLENLTHQYKDYSEWMKERNLTSQEQYWQNIYSDDIPILNMPLDYQRPKKQSFKGNLERRLISGEVASLIRKLSKETNSTEYMVFLSAAMVLLSKYSRQEDLIIGSPVIGRTHRDTEKMLGMFINTLAMRGKPEKEKVYGDFLNEIKEFCLQSYENQEYPYEELIDKLVIERDVSRNPMFDVMLVFQNNESMAYKLAGSEIEMINLEHTVSKFDLTFNIEKLDEGYEVFLEYNIDLYKPSTIQRILDSYISLLEQVSRERKVFIKDIQLISERDKSDILLSFNKTKNEYSRDRTIIDLFEEQVKKSPHKIAVVYDNKKLSYEQLNESSNKIAHILRKKGIGKSDLVGILSNKSLEMIVGIFGILKSGAAYIPIDSKYPKKRIKYILDDCNLKLLFVFDDNFNKNLGLKVKILNLMNKELYDSVPKNNPIKVNSPEDLAYIIYTSGTTGKPKGVMVEHRNVVSLNNYFKNDYEITEEDNILQFANYVFDASVWEMTMALYNGATLIIPTTNIIQDPKLLSEYCNKKEISIATIPPNYYVNMEPLNARIIITAGSESSKDIVTKSKNSRYINAYGPTENTIVATHWEYKGGELNNKIPIGKPIMNTQIYILDGDNLCGIGMPGEICIAGTNLSRGYLNNDKLTKEKFVNNPYGEGKIYRSGDLARWLEDGNIEFLGRIDEQVKIRGFRIELGEVESVLRKHKDICDVSVITREDNAGDKALYSYIVSEKLVDVSLLKDFLSKELPNYMIPNYFMQIDKIPMTVNGKVNKKALPKIEAVNINDYVEPRSEKEKVLSNIFKEVLGIKEVSVKDSFFALGGDSIKAMKVVSKMREAGYELNIVDAMSSKTISAMSEVAAVAEKILYEQNEVTGTVKETPIMKMFRNWNLEEPHHFNQSIMIKVDTTPDYVEEAIKYIVSHHDILRAIYTGTNLEILANDCKRYGYEVCDYRNNNNESVKTTEEQIYNKCDYIQRSMNLEKGPLIKFVLFNLYEGNYLFICIHHLLVDGVSWRILIEDINTALNQVKENKEIKLPKKTASFIEWSNLLDEYKKSDDLKKEIEYWDKIELDFEKGRLNHSHNEFEVGSGEESFELTEETTYKLLKESGTAYDTEINELLLSSFGNSIKEIFNQDNITITLEGHGRESLHKDIKVDRTVGWFTTTYPVILDCYEEIEESILKTKNMIRKIPNRGIGYSLVSNKSIDNNITFNYLGEINSNNKDGEKTYKIGNPISEKNKIFEKGISITGIVQKSKLSFLINYDKNNYSSKAINKLSNSFRNKLLDTIEHCYSRRKADVTTKTLDLQDLFENPTVAQLIELMETGGQGSSKYKEHDFNEIHSLLSNNKIGGKIAPKQSLGDTLITGVTGWLGAHILDSFLKNENAIAYCLVRGSDLNDSKNRLHHILTQYFGEEYFNNDRIVVICGDISQKINLDKNIKTIINCAANVKHYGEYDYFYDINVGGIKNLISLAKEKNAKLIHTSTASVAGNEFDSDPDFPNTVFSETSLFIGQPLRNVYVRSKFEAEYEILKAKLEGLEAVVIRVGNLTNRFSDFKFQKNYSENANLNRIKAFADLGSFLEFFKDLPIYGYSPVDISAYAVIKISQHYNDDFSIFHAYNHKSFPFGNMAEALNLDFLQPKEFIDKVNMTSNDKDKAHIYEAFVGDIKFLNEMSHVISLPENERPSIEELISKRHSNITLNNDFTVWYLSQIGFEWPNIDERYIRGYVKYFNDIGHWNIKENK